MRKVTILFSAVFISLFSVTSMQAQDLFFSEFIEGSGNSKAFEIFNPTDTAVDLGDYIVLGNYNGNPYNDTLRFPSGTMLESMDVFVVAHESADSAIIAVTDSVIEDPFASGTSFIAVFNGDDARGLFKITDTDTTLIDLFGTTEEDPGDGWDIAGVTNGTKDHTLVRKPTITEGNPDSVASFGTSAEDSEWVVFPQNYFSNIGSHDFGEYVPEPENGTIVNVNSDFQDAELGPTTGIDDWWILGGDYVDYEFVYDPDNLTNKLLKATITDIESAANPWDAQIATVNNMLEPNSTYIISTRLKYESVSDAATGTINFTSGDVGIHQYGLSVDNDVWTVATLDTVKTDTAVAANVGIHIAYDNHENGDVFHVDYIRLVKLDEVVEPTPPSTEQIVWNFEDPAAINSWVNGANSSQSFAANVDATEGEASLDWTYTVDPSESWGGSADIELMYGDYLTNLSEFDGMSLDYKVVSAANPAGNASFNIKVYSETPDTVAEFHYTIPGVLSDDSGEWQTADIPFESLATPSWIAENYPEDYDTDLYPDKITKIEMQVIVGSDGSETSGQILLDNMAPFEAPIQFPEPPYSVGDNLSYNGSFQHADLGDTEAVAWNITAADGSAAEVVDDAADDDRALKFDVSWSGNTNWYENEAVNEPLNVVEGETYRFSVMLKADEDGRIARPYIGVPASGGWERRPDFNTPEVELTTEYTEWSMEWTATAADAENTMRIAVEFNAEVNDGGTIYIDNAQVVKVLPIPQPPYSVGDNLSYNGSFQHTALGDTEADAWNISMADGSAAEVVDDAADDDERALMFDISWSGNTNWYENEAVNEPLNVVEGERYLFSVDLKADEDGRIARPYIGVPASGGWERRPDFNTPEVELTTEYTEWSMEWTATAADAENTMRIAVEFNAEVNDGGTIYIDNAQVVKMEAVSNENPDELPLEFALNQNYPNPFNPNTKISYTIPKAANVTLEVYNMLGQKVMSLVNERQTAGVKVVNFDASSLASGVYLYRIQAGNFVQTRRMTLIK